MVKPYSREIPQRIRTLLSSRPDLVDRYDHAKAVVRAFRRPAFYEIATRCNLKCEGCYYFEGGDTSTIIGTDPISTWDSFFEQEAARGVSMAYFVGAEPALEQDRLLAAAPYFPWGNIGTNGTIAIDKAVPYRIGVSVWAGDDASDAELRGGSVFRKALKNYRGDRRAIMLFTVSGWTIDQVETVAEMCADHDVALTFNIYSPTHSYLEKLASGAANDKSFFRVSTTQHTPALDDEALLRVQRALGASIDRFPDTVIYSHAYNDYICQPGSRYDIDPQTGIATDCGSRILEPMRYHTTDLTARSVKCCTPDVDCSQCRMYSGGWSSRFMPRPMDVANVEAFDKWLEMMAVLGRIFLYPREWTDMSGRQSRVGTETTMAAE